MFLSIFFIYMSASFTNQVTKMKQTMLSIQRMIGEMVDVESKSKFAGKILLSIPCPGDASKAVIWPPTILGSLITPDDCTMGRNVSIVKEDGQVCKPDVISKAVTEQFLEAVLQSHDKVTSGEYVPIIEFETLAWSQTGNTPKGVPVGKPKADVLIIPKAEAQKIMAHMKSGTCWVTIDK
jgi:hypothetical protein